MPTAGAIAPAPRATPPGPAYERRDVERTALYQLVRDHLETFYQAVEEGFASAPLPKFVKQEFERFLDCGVLCRGAALLVCDACDTTKVIALSCKGRAFCPSCLGRRMEQTAANLEEHVLPEGVPLRQWVLTFPFELRARLGFDGELLSELCGLVNRGLLDFYARAIAHDETTCVPSDAPSCRAAPSQWCSARALTSVSIHTSISSRSMASSQLTTMARRASYPLPHLASIDVAELLATLRGRPIGVESSRSDPVRALAERPAAHLQALLPLPRARPPPSAAVAC